MDSSTVGLEGLAFALAGDTENTKSVETKVESAQDASEQAQKLQEAIEQARREGKLLDSIHQLLSECRKLAFDSLNAPEGEPRKITQRHLNEVLGLVDDIAEGQALKDLDLTTTKGAVEAVNEIERSLAEISKQQWRLDELQKRKSLEMARILSKQVEPQPMQDSLFGLAQLDRAIRGSESSTSEQVQEGQLAVQEVAK